jgi:hypothetical protein
MSSLHDDTADRAPDRYREWDAAYVLGALSQPDRREYEEHLSECPDCRAAVADIAGIPGLLAKVPADAVLSESDLPSASDLPPLPASLTPESVRPPEPVEEPISLDERRWARRRRLRRVIGAAAVAVLSAAAAVLIVVPMVHSPTEQPNSQVVAARSLHPLGRTAITADVQLVDLGNGRTQLTMNCRYDQSASTTDYRNGYRLTVTTADGRQQQVLGWWVNQSQSTYRLSSDIDVAWDQIRTVQISDAAGATLLTTTV